MQTRRGFISGLLLATGVAALPRSLAGNAPCWQLGCYTRPWAQHDLRVAFDGIAAAGFKYAGLMTSKAGQVVTAATAPEAAARIAKEAQQRGLKISSVYGGGFPVERSVADGVAGLRRLIENSAACGCPNLLLGGTNEKLRAPYYKVVAECCDYAAAQGVGLSVKPHGGANANGAECRKIVAQVSHPDFRIWYDPGNIFYYSDGRLDPVEDAATVDGLVVGMSVKDYRPPKNVDVTPGNGLVNFGKVFARLQQGGFTGGALVVECLERGDLPYVNAEAVKARHFLEQLTGQQA